MAEDIVSGLFGMSPTDVALARQRQQQEAAAAYANMDALQAAKAGMFNLGGTIGRVGGQMLGLQDPMVVEAQQRQQGLAGIDMTDPNSILAAAKRFGDMGDVQNQIRLQLLAQKAVADKAKAAADAAKAEQEMSPFAKINPKDFTQESIRTFVQTKNQGDLVASGDAAKYSSYAQQLIDEGLQPGSPEFIQRMREYNVKELQGKGKPLVSLNLGDKGSEKYVEASATAQVADITQLGKDARAAWTSNKDLQNFLASSATAPAGALAGLQTQAMSLAESLGFKMDDLTSAAVMQQAIGRNKAAYMAALGARGLTDKDMEILADSLPKMGTSITARNEVAKIVMKANSEILKDYEYALEQEKIKQPKAYEQRLLPRWYSEYQTQKPGAPTADDPLGLRGK